MLRLTDKTTRAISSLKKTASFIEFTHYLNEELALSVKGLMIADPDRVQKLQGRTKFIQELLEVVETID